MSSLKSLYHDVRSAYNDGKRKADYHGAFYVYYFMRPLSFYVTPFFIRLGITANQATYVGTAAGLMAGWCLLTEGMSLKAASLLIALCEVMDHVDGNLARYYEKSSYFGKFVDSIGGSLAHVFWVLGLAFGLERYGEHFSLSSSIGQRYGFHFFPLVGLFMVVVMLFESYMDIRKEHLRAVANLRGNKVSADDGFLQQAPGLKSLPRRINRLASELFAPLFIVLPLLQAPDLLFVLIAGILTLQLPLNMIRTWIKASHDLTISK